MAKYRIYGMRTKEESQLEKNNRELARRIAEEGIVLLENNGVLPLKESKIALYGGGARLTVKGGSGSGDVRERYSVNIEDGLKNNGFEIAGSSWLNRFTDVYEKDKKAFRERVEAQIKGYSVWKVMDMFKKIGESKLDYPVGDAIRQGDLSDETDTCVYVIARQAGEGFDRRLVKGDYLLSDLEVNNLNICRRHYSRLVVIINAGSSLDLSELRRIGPDAIVFYGQAGEEGGNALGRILSGRVSPSGKLSDTWAYSYEDYPLSRIAHPENLEENYEEGIYVGYRWFDAMEIEPMYPFGHGLSYTSFTYAFRDFSTAESEVSLCAQVTNTGSVSGKETLFCFLYRPNCRYKGEVKNLAAFAKTDCLKPGESQALYFRFDLKDFAVYDEEKSCFILEEGDYGIALGTDALHTEMCAVLHMSADCVTEQCRPCCKKQKDFKDYEIKTKPQNYEGLPYKEVSAETFTHCYEYRLPEVSDKVKGYLETLSDEELAMFTMGGGYFTKQYIKVLGSCGCTTSLLLKKGIPNIIMSDGPAGLNIMPEAAYSRGGSVRYIDALPEEWQWGWLKTVMPKMRFLYAGKKDTLCYQYCTAFPSATLMAQTFNEQLVIEAGKGVGREMKAMGITLWLAPALNIHRDPLCGRNFEYYSEDPVVSGIMAAAITEGVQSYPGVGVTIKHFACNNREDDRTKVSSNLSEKALREIYLKGFRMACAKQPMALMTSYNRLNGTYTAANAELLIDILRCEWGYEGLVMSDWDGAASVAYADAVRNGNNMIMPGNKEVYRTICENLKEGTLSRRDVSVSALYALKMIFAAATTKDFEREVKQQSGGK